MNPAMKNALGSYAQVGVESGVAGSSPHQLITMLFDGALAAIAKAKRHMGGQEVNDIGEKGKAVSQAIAIVEDGLMASLDIDAGGELAQNLYALYEYMSYRLMKANLHNDVSGLDEVANHLAGLREAWAGIAPNHSSQMERDPRRLGAGSYGHV